MNLNHKKEAKLPNLLLSLDCSGGVLSVSMATESSSPKFLEIYGIMLQFSREN